MENEEIKLSFKEKIQSKFNTGTLRSFFMSKWHPTVVAALVVLGHTFGIEVYLCLINMILFATAMITCDSVRPLIITLCTFTWQVPLKHSPAGPVWSDHYLSGASPYLLGLSALIIVSTFVYIIIKFKVFKGLSFLNTPLLGSMCVLGVAFLLNGAFSSTWRPADLMYGALQAVLFPFLFLVFYKGMKRERDFEELGLYIAYVAAMMGIIMTVEMADLYIFGNDYYGTIFNEAGAVIKDRIHLGWATWNPAGICTAVLIPMIFYGVIKSKRPWGYLLVACMTYVSALLTFSRNSMIMATLAFGASVLVACLFGERRRKVTFRIICAVALVGVAFFVIVFWREIKVFAKDIFDRGLSDNGRFTVWSSAIKNFKQSPIFGTGFYHFSSPVLYNYSPAVPLMAHQTFLQLLSSMGVVGLAAYLYYRIDTLEMFFRKPTLMKSMLGGSALVMLAGSLLDNFIFTIFPLFFYSVMLAVSAIIFDAQKEEEDLLKKATASKKRRKKKK